MADRQAAVGEEGQAVVANPTGPVRRGGGYENVSHIGHTIPWSCMRMSSTRCCSASSARALWSYSVLSVREYANYHGLELRFAKGLMVITQLAELEGRYLTDAEMVEELQLAGFLDDIADLSPGRSAE